MQEETDVRRMLIIICTNECLCIISLCTYISKLDQPQLSELTYAVIFRA